VEILDRIDTDNEYASLREVLFSDESTFHISGQVNRPKGRIWGSQIPHVTQEIKRGSLKINV
jgi:hypothetical protein